MKSRLKERKISIVISVPSKSINSGGRGDWMLYTVGGGSDDRKNDFRLVYELKIWKNHEKMETGQDLGKLQEY